MKRIAFLDTVHAVLWDRLTQAGCACEHAENLTREEILTGALADHVGIVLRSRLTLDAAIMDAIAPTLKGGKKMLSHAVDCPYGEGTIGGPLAEIQNQHPKTMIGSYPKYEEGNYTTQIVVRGRDAAAVAAAIEAVDKMLDDIRP